MNGPDMAKVLREMLELLRRRDRALLRRGLISAVDDTGAVQLLDLKGIFGMLRKKVEAFQPFGFGSNPPAGAEYVQVQVNGDAGNQIVVVAFDRRYRITGLQPGESVMFNQWGDFVKMGADRHIRVQANAEVDVTAPNVTVNASTKVTLQTPLVECTQGLKVDGNLEVDGTSDLKGAVTAETSVTSPTIAGTTDVLIGPAGKSGVAHKHTGVTVGAGISGGMQ